MLAKLIVTVAALSIASGAAAQPLPAARAHVVRSTVALDDIIGRVQLDALIATIVPAKPAPIARREAVADAVAARGHDRG